MKFSSNMNDYCSYCFRKLFGTEECNCEKTIIEKQRDKEIVNAKQEIIDKYSNLLKVDNKAIEEFKANNNKCLPSYW